MRKKFWMLKENKRKGFVFGLLGRERKRGEYREREREVKGLNFEESNKNE